MDLQFFCPHWGSEHLPFGEFASRVKAAGYDGVEMSLPYDPQQKEIILETLSQKDLLWIAQHWETVDSQIGLHRLAYEQRLRHLAAARPLFINTQTGKDYFSFEENSSLIRLAASLEQETGVRILHETHRGKFSFAAHITRDYLLHWPGLQLTLDVSHWCAVAETFLEDQLETLQLAIRHTHHVHARVGYTEGPQVPSPKDDLWKEALGHHLRWWQAVVDLQIQRGADVMTITPEFGAPPYTVLLPQSHQPISDPWENNLFMMAYLKSNLRLF
ncbi:MAG: sugar phosphate isomerase/epimerase family protein [Flavisolibacter sp.]